MVESRKSSRRRARYQHADGDAEDGRSVRYKAKLQSGEDLILSGDCKLTADEGRLDTDKPKFARTMTAYFARRHSADLGLWETYTDPDHLPSGIESRPAAKTAAYQAEVVPRGHKSSRSVFGLPMLRPESKAAWRWKTFIMAIDCTYTAFLVPLSFAFFHDVRVFNWMTVLDILGGVVYVVDLLMNFQIGVVLTRSMQARVLLSGRMVAWFYIRRSTFVLDFIASLPVCPEIVLVAINTEGDKYRVLAEVTTWIRLTRMFRLYPLLQSLIVLSLTGYHHRRMLRFIPSSVLLLLHVGFVFLFLANFLSNLWAYTAIAQGTENSWMRTVGSNQADISGASGVTQYLSSLYYVVTTLATVGYGDISASTNAERVVAVIIMTIGIAFFGFLLGVLQSLIQYGSAMGRRAIMFREKIADVECWMKYCEMPPGLRKEIRAFYAEVYVRHEEVDEEEIFSDLPHHLRGRVTSFLLDDMLRESDAFKCLDSSGRLLLSAMLRAVPVAPGHLLFPQGSEARSLFILQDGELAMYRNTVEVARLAAPFLLGQSSILNACDPDAETPQHHPVASRAVSLCMVWELCIEDLIPLLNVRPGLKESLLQSLQRVMKRWGAQQPEESCWSDAEAKASEWLRKLSDSKKPSDSNGTQSQDQQDQAQTEMPQQPEDESDRLSHDYYDTAMAGHPLKLSLS